MIFNQGVVVIVACSFLEGHEEGQRSDGVCCEDQRVDRHRSENILEDAGQAETYRSKKLRYDYDAEKNEDLSAESEGDERSCNVERVIPTQVCAVQIIRRQNSHEEADDHGQVFREVVWVPKTFEEAFGRLAVWPRLTVACEEDH